LTHFKDEPVDTWKHAIENSDIEGDYLIVFSAIVASAFSLIFPWEITQKIVTLVITNFPRINKKV